MFWKQLFATKSLETLHAEAASDNRLRRVLGPIGLTSLGVGAIIGAGIFVMTGRAAAIDAGPAIMISYMVAGVGCLFAALCYAEFASMAPVAGSAYTYAYATLGEVLAWIIGWDLILEYAMACACVASSWSKYLNEFLLVTTGTSVPPYLCNDPFSTPGAWFNLPALLIILAVTVILVLGIRESATTNAILVAVKLGVVLFVIGAGLSYINPANWHNIPVAERLLPEEHLIPTETDQILAKQTGLDQAARRQRHEQIVRMALAQFRVESRTAAATAAVDPGADEAKKAQTMLQTARLKYGPDLPATEADKSIVAEVLRRAREKAPAQSTARWGMLGYLGVSSQLESIDDAVRSPFMPYGLAGIIFGASIVFFAYIGFDSISTHSEEARRPAVDVPIAILASLFLCTVLYIAVSGVITGMVPYPEIDSEAAIASAFRQKGEQQDNMLLHAAAGLIATGALAGMTSVLLITFLSQARIFLAMARDHLLPPAIFAAIHPRFRTPHISTILTGVLMALVAAFTPITKLEEMVNIGTLMAFVIVCAAVLLLRIRRPDAHRPFRSPLIWLVAPAGIFVNMLLMLFLPLDTWLRLVIWLVLGLLIYFGYGFRHSLVRHTLLGKGPVAPVPAPEAVKV